MSEVVKAVKLVTTPSDDPPDVVKVPSWEKFAGLPELIRSDPWQNQFRKVVADAGVGMAGAQGAQGPPGPQGPPGEAGPTAPVASIKVVTGVELTEKGLVVTLRPILFYGEVGGDDTEETETIGITTCGVV